MTFLPELYDTPTQEKPLSPLGGSHIPELIQGTKYSEYTTQITHDLLKQGDRGFDQYVAFDAGNVKNALEIFKGISPEIATKVQRLAKKEQLSFYDLYGNQEEAFQWDEAKKIYDSLYERDPWTNKLKYPYTAAYLSDPGAMLANRDDIETYRNLESLITKYKPTPVFMLKQFWQSEKAWLGKRLQATEKIHEILGEKAEELTLPKIIDLALSNPPYLSLLLGEKIIGGKAQKGISKSLQKIEDLRIFEPVQYERQQGTWENFWIDWSANFPQIVNGIITAYAGGAPIIGSAGMGMSIFTDTYNDLKAKGVSEERARKGAAAHAIAETILETPVISKYMELLGATGLKEVGWGVITSFTENFVQEVLQEHSGDISQKWAENPDKSYFEIAQMWLVDFIQTTKHGAYAGLLTLPTALFGGMVSLPVNITRARVSGQHVDYWNGIVETINNSKSTDRNPNGVKNFIDNTADSTGGLKTFFVPIDSLKTFFQGKPKEFNDFANDMQIHDQLEDAQTTGKDIEIPVSNYTTKKYPGSDLDNAIFDDIYFQGGMSRKQRAHLNEEMAAELETVNKNYLKELRENRLPKQFYQMRTKLMSPKEEGGFGLLAEDADAELKVFLSGATVLSRKSGETLDQWFKRVNPVIQVGGQYISEKTTEQQPRGSVTFADGKTLINLYKSADVSTFIHESGHIFFNEMRNLVESGKADAQLQKDFQTLINFAFKGETPPQAPIYKEQAPLTTEEIIEKFPMSDFELASAMYDEIKVSQAGFRIFAKEEVEGAASTFPEYFKNKGFTKKDALRALNKVLKNKKLGKKEQKIYDSLLEDKKFSLIEESQSLGIPLTETIKKEIKPEFQPEVTTEPEGEVDTSFEFGANIKKQFQGLKDDDIDFEKIAKAFEQYVKEGKAPSAELISSFRRLRNWLTAIYKALKEQQLPEINDEVRAVFDRLLASQEEIEAASQYYGHKFKLEEYLDIDEKKKADLAKKREDAKTASLDNQAKKYLRAYNKALEAGNKIKDQAANLINKTPIYMAIDEAVQGGGINFDQVFNRYGSSIAQKISANHKNVLDKEGTIRIEELAAKYGYDSEDEFVNDLAKSLPKKDAIKAKIKDVQNQVEQEIRGDLEKQEEITGEEAIHTDAHMSTMIAEAELLAEALKKKGQKVQRPKNVTARTYRDAAEDLLFRKPVKTATRYDVYARSELKYFKQFEKFIKAGKLEQAYEAKEKQILNHAMVQAAVRNRDLRQKIETRSKKLGNLKPDKYNFAHREAILALLARYGLGTPKMIPQRPDQVNITDLVKKASEVGYPVIMPDWVMNMQGAKNYKDMPFVEFLELYDSMAQLKKWGDKSLQSRVLSDIMKEITGETKDFIIDDVAQRAAEPMATLSLRSVYSIANDPFKYTFQSIKRNFLSHISFATLYAQEADGYTAFGPGGKAGLNQKLFLRAPAQCDSAQKNMWDTRIGPRLSGNGDIKVGLEAIYKRLRKENGKVFEIQGLPYAVHPNIIQRLSWHGQSGWTSEKVIAACLNTGNEKNLKALMGGFGWDETHIAKLRSMLTAEEWGTIQNLWDLISSFFDEANEVYFRVNDTYRKKEEAMAFDVMTADGQAITMKGGYYPLFYDRKLSWRTERQQEEQSLLDRSSAIYQNINPKAGFMVERKGVTTLAPDLKISVIYDHLSDVVHYITHEEVMRDLWKIIQNNEWEAGITEHFGADAYKEFQRYLKYVSRPNDTILSKFDYIANRYRKLTTLYYLGFKLKTGIKTSLSFGAGAQNIGWNYATQGIEELFLKRGELIDEIHNKSDYMRNRWGLMDREVREQLDWKKLFSKRIGFHGKEFGLKDFQDFTMILIKLGDGAVTHTLWKGAYNKFINENSNIENKTKLEKDAIAYADDVISQSQPTARDMDLADWQRGNHPGWRLMAMFQTATMKYGHRTRAYFRGWKDGQISNKQYMRHLFNEQLLPMAILFLLGENFRQLLGIGDGDDDTIPKELTVNLIRQLSSGYPLLNQASHFITSDYPRDLLDIPALQAISRVHGKTLWKAKQEVGYAIEGDPWGKAASDFAYALAMSIEFEMGVPAIRAYRDIMRSLEDY